MQLQNQFLLLSVIQIGATFLFILYICCFGSWCYNHGETGSRENIQGNRKIKSFLLQGLPELKKGVYHGMLISPVVAATKWCRELS